MMEWILSSSALILVILLIRRLTLGKISMRLRYVLWGLVLVRLLVPFSFGSSTVSVMNTMQQVPAVQQAQALQAFDRIEREPGGVVNGYIEADSSNQFPTVVAEHKSEAEFAQMTTALNVRDVLIRLWKIGVLALGAVFLLSNLCFRRSLRKNRTRLDTPNCPLPVYVTDRVETPCLFGLFRPAIYVTPEAREQPQNLHYALEHELTHFYQGDFLWSILRCVCLSLHWFNPLVWLAVKLSRQDAELACDEGTIRRIGESHRTAYGNTLIDLTCARRRPSDLLHAATTMTGSKKSIRERVTFIARKPRNLALAVVPVALVTAVAVGCTFTGADKPEARPDAAPEPLTEEELTFFQENFFTQNFTIANQFLDSMYTTPENIDLFALFYNGTTLPGAMSEEEQQTLMAAYPDAWASTECIKLPVQDMDTILEQYTGLKLADTKQLGLEHFTYLEEYDAYYDFHGDTNARLGVTFTAGFRQGDQVSLYYEENKVVTLREAGDSWHILSNGYAPTPTAVVQLPKEKPFLTVPVNTLSASEPRQISTTPFTRREWEQLANDFFYQGTDGQPNRNIMTGVWPDGNLYACYAVFDNWEDTYYRFLQLCDAEETPYYLEHPEELVIRPYTGLLGRDGFSIDSPHGTFHYFFDAEERLCRDLLHLDPIPRQFAAGSTLYAFHDNEQPELLIWNGTALQHGNLLKLLGETSPGVEALTWKETSEDGVALYGYTDASTRSYRELRVACDGENILFYHGGGKTDTDPAANPETPEFWGIQAGDGVELILHQSPGHELGEIRWREGLWDIPEAAHYFRHLTDLNWIPAEPVETADGVAVTLVTQRFSLTAYEGTTTVRKETPGGAAEWLKPDSEDFFDKPYEFILRSWFDELEYQHGDDGSALFVPDKGQTWQEAVAAFAENYPAAQPDVSYGSQYAYSFLRAEAQPEPEITDLLRERGEVDENTYAFWVRVIFVPENQRALIQAMPGNTDAYAGDDPAVPDGAYEYLRCCFIHRDADGWHVEINGTAF